MKIIKNIAVMSSFMFLVGCAATPHTFQSQWSEEILPEATSIEGDNSITGSAFLRQGGGGTVTCAGNDVLLNKQVYLERSAYAREVNSLSYYVRNASAVDPRHAKFEAKLQRLNDSQTLRTNCDVDGKFQFPNLAPGNYMLKTKVYWVVASEGQGGIVGKSITIPDDSSNLTFNAVISDVIRSCRYAFDGCLVE